MKLIEQEKPDASTEEGRKALTEKLAALIRLQRSAPFDMIQALARQRSVWIERNIPTYMHSQIWEDATRLVEEHDNAK